MIKIIPDTNKSYKFTQFAIDIKLVGSVSSLDWSIDSQFVLLNTVRNEIKLVDVQGKKVVTSNQTSEKHFETWTNTLGWSVQGIYPIGRDTLDVISVSRSVNKKFVVSGDTQGRINLFSYPAVKPNALFK